MTKIKNILLLLICTGYSLSVFANGIRPITCKDSQGFSEIKEKIISIDKTFRWDSLSCNVVGTKSIFPRKNKNGIMKFEKGLQIFVYDNYQLQFICLPGWVCKQWD